jgi:hypothetical protein
MQLPLQGSSVVGIGPAVLEGEHEVQRYKATMQFNLYRYLKVLEGGFPSCETTRCRTNPRKWTIYDSMIAKTLSIPIATALIATTAPMQKAIYELQFPDLSRSPIVTACLTRFDTKPSQYRINHI